MTELDRAQAELERLRRMVQEQEKRVAALTALTATRPRKLVLLGGIPRIITTVGLDRIAITDGLGAHWGANHVKATTTLGEWGEAFELKWDADNGEFYIETRAQLELTL